MKKPGPRQSFYDALDWLVIRSPLLPLAAYLAIGATAHPSATGWRRESTSALPADPLVKLALTIGSGHLVDALDAADQTNAEARGKLLRYQIRMSTRPTPYGIFAGVGLGSFGHSTA